MSTAADLDWILARDGSRTARPDGRWLGGCSVPRRAAQMMLRNLRVRGNVVCLLLPTHAQQVQVCLETMDESGAVIVIASDTGTIDLMCRCCDFDPAISSGRLFFASDEQSLRNLFAKNPGLPIPGQFVRLPVVPQQAGDDVIRWAQSVFSEVSAAQTRRAAAARAAWKPGSDRLCVVASGRFRLWADEGHTLANALQAELLNTDDPRQSASAHITERVLQAGALITVNFGRADQRDMVAAHMPWITWITQNRVPAYVEASAQDGLLLADESFASLARDAGWPANRVRVAQSPVNETPAPGSKRLAIIADIPEIKAPPEVEEFSSWRVVWGAIEKDLLENPHRLAGDVSGYLEKSRRHFQIPPENFPERLFIDQLIAPAYLRGIIRWLVREGIEFDLHGSVSKSFDISADICRGAILDRTSLSRAIATCGGLIDPFIRSGHPVSSTGRALVTTFGRTPQRILQECRRVIAGSVAAPSVRSPLSRQLIDQMLA